MALVKMALIIDIFQVPKKASANKGKFYSGIPLKRLDELKSGSSIKYKPVSNFYDFAVTLVIADSKVELVLRVAKNLKLY